MHELESRKRVDVSICMQCQRKPSRKVAKNKPRWSAGELSGRVQMAGVTSHLRKWSIVYFTLSACNRCRGDSKINEYMTVVW